MAMTTVIIIAEHWAVWNAHAAVPGHFQFFQDVESLTS